MTDFVPAEKAVPIRQPATANLMIDSADRALNPNGNQPNPFDFQITKNNSIMNGYFTRIGTTEVVLEWNEPNGAYMSTLGTTQVHLLSSGISTVATVPNLFNPAYFYDAALGINNWATLLSFTAGTAFSLPGTSNAFVSTVGITQTPFIITPGLQVDVISSPESGALGLPSIPAAAATVLNPSQFIVLQAPDLRPYRYLDFTSQQLTYNQDLKDTATSPFARDVLCRWYFDWDQQPQRDTLGFPIEMGYEPFKLRRLFNPPKQIRWDPKQPAGNLAFQVYGDGQPAPIQPIASGYNGSQWLMTLQVSES